LAEYITARTPPAYQTDILSDSFRALKVPGISHLEAGMSCLVR
jgi:hypothetical protein